jgi:predicted permease
MAKGYLANKLVALEAGSGVSEFRRQYGRPLWLLMAITGLVLLIACANIANLLLARGSAREPEIAVRLAIGASRGRLARQLLAESLLLATSGGALGVGVAFVLSRALVAFIGAPDNPIFINVALDWRVLGFAVALAAATCALFGLAPALRATRMPPISAMRSGGRSVTAGSERFSLRRALVTTQIALALVLLYGALLFTRSLHNLLTVDTGFRPEGILSVDVDFSKSQCPSGRRLTVYRELSERLSALPGVGSVAQVSFTPVSGGTWNNLVAPDGEVAARGKESFFNEVGPGYFGTMGTRLIAGREFNDHDAPPSPKVAIVNEAFAKRLFGGANPVGRAFHMAADAGVPEPIFQVVGLVANTKYRDLREDFRPIAFFPIAQNQRPGAEATFVLRVNGSPGRIMNGAKATVAAMSPSIGIEFRPLTAQLQESLLRERLMAMTSGGFGFLAALLSALGLYGVIAYLVARRRKELGVRIALGAGRKRVIMLVFRETFLTVCAGLTVGIALALWAGKAAAALLYGLQAHDAVSLVAASGLLTVIAFIASYAPARRAAAINPIETLRNE